MPVDENQETYSVGMQTMRYAINIVVTYTSCPGCQKPANRLVSKQQAYVCGPVMRDKVGLTS